MPDSNTSLPTDRQRRLESLGHYHRASTLYPSRRPQAPERLERATEPNPFRQLIGAPTLTLPNSRESGVPWPLPSASTTKTPFDAESLGGLLQDAFGLVGWRRSADARFGMRTCPSAGNRQPTEVHLLTGPGVLPALTATGTSRAALWHYDPFAHALELRAELPDSLWRSVHQIDCAVLLSSLPWRTAWKYGERAFRLMLLDAGHALASLRVAAGIHGWMANWHDALDEDLAAILAADRDSGPGEEIPLACLQIASSRTAKSTGWRFSKESRKQWTDLVRFGQPTLVAAAHRRWPAMRAAQAATRRDEGSGLPSQGLPSQGAPSQGETEPTMAPSSVAPSSVAPRPTVFEVVRRRRSRLDFETEARLPAAQFLSFLDAVANGSPRSCLPWPRQVEILVFVHRVTELASGLYYAGPTRAMNELRGALRSDLRWAPVEGTDALRLLAPGDARQAAVFLTGGQEAAGEALFTLAFLAPVQSAAEREGPWAYRRLHWQAGELGHRAYLEATAHGLAANGLAGFWDEKCHEFLGLPLSQATVPPWQMVYFVAIGAVGGPQEELEGLVQRERPAKPLPASRGGFELTTPS